MPTVSIIVPIFDGTRYLPSFLESLAAAVPPNAELIFVDDGSGEPVLEGVPDFIASIPVTKLRNDENRGYSAAVNRGFDCAKGEILVQLNTDLVLDRHCITAMIEWIETRPGTGIVGSKQIHPTSGLTRHIGMAFGKHSYRHIYAGLPANHSLCCRSRAMQIVSGATAAMSRRVLTDIGPLDERYYNTHENFVHCLRARDRGYTNYTCAESVAYHWVGQSGPARYARVEEDDALFWSEWGCKYATDLGDYVDGALDNILASHPDLSDYAFEPLRLCRSADEEILIDSVERRWKGAALRCHRSRVFNSPHKNLWLPMELPHRMRMNPAAYIYLVDQAGQLAENRMWFESRRQLVQCELVLDVRASAMTTDDLLATYGERPQ